MKIKKGYCVLCGVRFMQQGAKAYRCSNCRDVNAAKQGINKRFCFACGKEFELKVKNEHFCSDECKKNKTTADNIKRKETMTSIQQKAHKEHLTYGQYVAKYGL